MKNKICTILLLIAVSMPVYALQDGVSDTQVNSEQSTEIVQEDNIQTEQQAESIPPVVQDEGIYNAYKKPISKKRIAKKFLLAMLGVMASSLIIYAGLALYNKIRSELISGNSVNQEDETQLSSPGDFTDAVKSFLDKTKWD